MAKKTVRIPNSENARPRVTKTDKALHMDARVKDRARTLWYEKALYGTSPWYLRLALWPTKHRTNRVANWIIGQIEFKIVLRPRTLASGDPDVVSEIWMFGRMRRVWSFEETRELLETEWPRK